MNYEELIREATDESIPNGELNIVKALELTDLIRSKKAPAKEVMRSLKKRLIFTKNPNLQLSCLELVDFSIKNGGLHFISEISTREFLDSLSSKILHDDDVDYSVQQKTLKLIQSWAKVFSQSLEFKSFTNLYENLQKQGFEFPIYEGTESKVMFDSTVPPEWEDSDACMICSTAFSLMNRKHHCRNCGGVYCGEHSSKFVELPDLGITEKVRVCDNCYDEVKAKKKSHKKKKKKDVIKARLNYDSEEDDDDLKKALELSLKESQRHTQAYIPEPAPTATVPEEEDDEDLKAAIAASLRDIEGSQQSQAAPPAAAPEAPEQYSMYNNLLPHSKYQYQQEAQPPSLPPQVYQDQQLPPSFYNNRLTSQEEHAVRRFTTKTMEAKYNPNEVENLTEYYKQAVPLQPKLNNELNDSISKYDQFVDLNYKIDQTMRLYNKILDDRIEKESYGYKQQQYQHQQQQHSPIQPQYTAQPVHYASPANQVPQPAPYQTFQPSEPPQQSYPQYVPQSPQQYHQSPVISNQVPSTPQYTGESLYTNPTGNSNEQDPFKNPQENEYENEDEYSAPLGPSEVPIKTVQPQYTAPQAAQQPTYAPAPAAIQSNKITDFNFPNVPLTKVYPGQEVIREAPPVHEEPAKEELLIEL